jgi:hypothetical protein
MPKPKGLSSLLAGLLIYVGAAEAQSLLRDFDLPIPLYAPGSAWNQRADDVTVLPQSEQQMLVLYRVLRGDNSLGGGREGNRILEAGTIDDFDVDGPGANVIGYWSARATGTPLLAGSTASVTRSNFEVVEPAKRP